MYLYIIILDIKYITLPILSFKLQEDYRMGHKGQKARRSVINKYRKTIDTLFGSPCIRITSSNPHSDAQLKEQSIKVVKSMHQSIVATYLSQFPVITINGNFVTDIEFTGNIISADELAIHEVKELIDRLYSLDPSKKTDRCKIFKVVADNVTILVFVESDGKIMIAEYYNDYQLCIVRRTTLDRTTDATQLVLASCICKRAFDGERFLKNYKNNICDIVLSGAYVETIDNLIRIAIDNGMVVDCNNITYSQLELKTISRIVNSFMNHGEDLFGVNLIVNKYINASILRSDSISRFIDSIYSDTVYLDYAKANINRLPMVNFSEKEWSFIYRYMKGKLDNEDHAVSMNIIPILQDQRYGRYLKFKYIYPDDSSCTDLVITYLMNIDGENPSCRFIMIYIIDDANIVYQTADFVNIDKFNMFNSFVGMECRLSKESVDDLPMSINEASEIIPRCFRDHELSYDLITDTLFIFTIIHDRPQRYRIVREEKQNQTKVPSRADGQSHLKFHTISNTEGNEVISRILLPALAAKEYIYERNNSDAERCYIMESWERRGHWRKKPNSEDKIWIEETTCKRRKELSGEKKIIVKL